MPAPRRGPAGKYVRQQCRTYEKTHHAGDPKPLSGERSSVEELIHTHFGAPSKRSRNQLPRGTSRPNAARGCNGLHRFWIQINDIEESLAREDESLTMPNEAGFIKI
jgi:hypothetical protein